MDGFRDSSSIAGDRQALRERIAEDGYVFFRGLVEPAVVDALREDVLSILSKHGWVAEGNDEAVVQETYAESHSEYYPVYVDVQRLESFHRFAHDERVLAALKTLVADDALPHPRKVARLVHPDAPKTPPHQDYTHIQGTADFFTAWTPLTACPFELGGLRILRGSHPEGIRKHLAMPGAGGAGVDITDDDPDWVSAEYDVGDVVVFHPLVVHGSMLNSTRRFRLSVDNRYQSASEPIVDASLRPHLHPRVPDWDNLTDGWSETRWIEAPDGMRIVEFHRPKESVETWHTELELPESRFVRLAGP